MVIKKRHQVRILGGAVIRLGTRTIMTLGSGETAAKILLVSPGWSTGGWIFCQLPPRFAQSGTRNKNHLSFLKRVRIFPANLQYSWPRRKRVANSACLKRHQSLGEPAENFRMRKPE